MNLESMVLIGKLSNYALAIAYVITAVSLFLIRLKYKNIGLNIAIFGFIGLFVLSFLTVFTGHLVGLETLKEIAIYRYFLDSICFLSISIGCLVFSISVKKTTLNNTIKQSHTKADTKTDN